ncbi:DsbC family protein [Geomonas sp.]|uniref:DsbC family protein n=1 Tax=Geomonas sp. TaxID=2651584 RepID=UPI002B4A6724|nr:DsbC family protein [Geomonas sp.]HJV36494.1 DsbC family protein [Geomonas sp.]
MTEYISKRIRRFILAPLFLTLLLAPKAPAADSLDLTKAIKVGSGKVMVIEFTDPDCPYCRKAEAYFRTQPQVTRYIFLLPLPMHPGAKGKTQYILSAKDKEKAYLEVESGKFDRGPTPGPITPEGIHLQKEHQEIAQANSVRSTPTFMVYGRVIVGFDMNKLAPLLK